MEIFKLFVTFMGLAMSFAYYPQAYKMYRTKSAQGISLFSYFLFGFGTITLTIYGFLIKDPTIIFSFIFGVLGSWLVIFLTFLYRKNN